MRNDFDEKLVTRILNCPLHFIILDKSTNVESVKNE